MKLKKSQVILLRLIWTKY